MQPDQHLQMAMRSDDLTFKFSRGTADSGSILVPEGDNSAMQSSEARLSLADMPAAWLQPLPALLTPSERLSLFKTCTALRDQVLSECSVGLQWHHHTLQDSPEAAQASLNLACKLSPSVKLVLRGSLETPVDISTAACILVAGGVDGPGLTAVHSVELQGLILDGLVPTWLSSTCPHTTRLQLLSCRFDDLPGPDTSIPDCGQLQLLQLHRAPFCTVLQAPLWQHQLRSLTGLQSLSFCSDDEREPQVSQLPWLSCCSVIGPQLTHLSVSGVAGLGLLRLPADLPAWFPTMRHLHLHNSTIHDDDMEVLLRMHTIRLFQCRGFSFDETYEDRRCSWQELIVAELNLNSVTRLPLEGVTVLRAIQPHVADLFAIVGILDAYVVNRAIAVIGQCGVGLQWGRVDQVWINVSSGVADTVLAPVLPLLAGCPVTRLSLSGARHVTPELLRAMGQHLTSPSLEAIKFLACSFRPEAWPLVLTLGLPPQVRTLSFDLLNADLTEADLTEMCVHACRPVCVDVGVHGSGWQVGWVERVQAAMAAAGHRHVTIITQPAR